MISCYDLNRPPHPYTRKVLIPFDPCCYCDVFVRSVHGRHLPISDAGGDLRTQATLLCVAFWLAICMPAARAAGCRRLALWANYDDQKQCGPFASHTRHESRLIRIGCVDLRLHSNGGIHLSTVAYWRRLYMQSLKLIKQLFSAQVFSDVTDTFISSRQCI